MIYLTWLLFHEKIHPKNTKWKMWDPQKSRETNCSGTIDFTDKILHTTALCGKIKNFRNYHTTVWKLRNFTATILPQKFRQINFLLKKFTLNWIDEKKFAWQWISCFPTECEKTRNSLSQNFFFREINSLLTYLVETLLSRNFCQKCLRVNFRSVFDV